MAQTALLIAAIIGGLIALRLLLTIPGWIRRTYRPERREIRVFGVGGGGSNAVDWMVASRIPGVSFVACNTDAQALRRSKAATKVRIGESITRGLGAGGDPEVGRKSAEEDEARITRAVAGADLVFITAGLGGGTGSGAAPIIGADARLQGALTIAVVTKPFAFEGAQRLRIADAAMTELAKSVDAIITIPNDRIADVVADDTSMLDAFRVVDDVLLQVVRGIIDLLRGPGLINLDFADVRAIMRGAGPTLIGLGHGSGEGRALEAARQAIASPLLEARIQGARGILFNVSGPPDLNLSEVRLAADEIRASADPDANIIFGASLGRPAGEDVVITLIATGLERPGGTEAAAVDSAGAAGEETHAEPPEAAIEPAEAEPTTDGGDKSQPEVVARAQPHALPTKAPVIKAPTPSSGGRTSGAPGAKRVDVEMPSFLRRKRPS